MKVNDTALELCIAMIWTGAAPIGLGTITFNPIPVFRGDQDSEVRIITARRVDQRNENIFGTGP